MSETIPSLTARPVAKYRDPTKPGHWFLTDFTMEQVEGRLAWLEAEVAALRQRAEALEKERDDAKAAAMQSYDLFQRQRDGAEAAERDRDDAEAALALEADERRCAEADREAEIALKRTAYAKLDQTREVVEKTLIPALERIHVNRLVDDGETCSCGECSQCLASAAIAAARKTLED